MSTADQLVAKTATESLNAGVRSLLRRWGTEDHGEIVWMTFSDDEGVTRVVYEVLREHAHEAPRLLSATRLKDELEAARAKNVKKVCWSL